MIKRKFTKGELGFIQDLCIVQFGEGELLAIKVAGQKLHSLEFVVDGGRSYPIKAEDMMEMFPTDPFWYHKEFWGIVVAFIAAGVYYACRG
jgi:hypothetical protein